MINAKGKDRQISGSNSFAVTRTANKNKSRNGERNFANGKDTLVDAFALECHRHSGWFASQCKTEFRISSKL
ncbi:MAG: hypothetical protein DWI02_06265 [Planctomycetota bacterium]|nr:MAG: hypothetical protein DWI02_06265 [Planctomycetota bacterium]